MSLKGKRGIWIIASLCLVLLVLCAVGFFALAIVIPALMCNRDIKSPHLVNVSPLENVTWHSDTESIADFLDLSIFDSYEILDTRFVTGQDAYHWEEGTDSEYSNIDVELILFDNIMQAEDSFHSACEHSWYQPDVSDFTFGGSGADQYCISYVKEATADPEGLCRPLGYYYSYVIFRKGNLLITIRERTSDKASTRKNALIEQLAQELGD
jgi:hypothetical protein